MDALPGIIEAARVQLTDTEKALRANVRSHNFAVVMSSGMALIFSVIGWAVLYGASYWLTMIVATLALNGEGSMPAIFNTVFLGSAVVLMLAARLDQWMFPSERTPDERPPVEHFADILFFVPRFTMSCWQNLGALAHLSRNGLADAARLMDHLKVARRVSLQELPSMFPDEGSQRHVLEALFVMGLVDQRREESMTWLYLGALAPEVFRDRAGALPAPEDPLAGVPQVKIRRRVRLLRPPEDGGEGA
jgi:hypothetical protein